MMDWYTGIGSRETPQNIMNVMEDFAQWAYADMGLGLRSGGADGADSAFEIGCDSVFGIKKIYVPWKSFNGRYYGYVPENLDELFQMARMFNKDVSNDVPDSFKKLFARNVCQVLEDDPLNNPVPSKFLVCYTPEGKYKGGTRIAMRVADAYEVPIINLYGYSGNSLFNIKEMVKGLLINGN